MEVKWEYNMEFGLKSDIQFGTEFSLNYWNNVICQELVHALSFYSTVRTGSFT